MAWPSSVLGLIRAFRGQGGSAVQCRSPEGESETWRRAQRLKRQPVRAGRRPPRSGALEEASTSPTLHRTSGVRLLTIKQGHDATVCRLKVNALGIDAGLVRTDARRTPVR